MTVRSTKGLKIFLSKTGAATITKDGTSGTSGLTAIAANATTSTHTDATLDDVTGIDVGSIVSFAHSGFPELDGKSFPVLKITGNVIEIGADISGSSGTFNAADVEATILPLTELTNLCPSSIGIDANVPGTISVGTFCDPSASIPASVSEAGNITLGLYHDPDAAGFLALLKAEQLNDNRTLVIQFSGDQGYLIANGVVSSFSISDIPLDGATAWQATFALSSKPELRF